MKKYELGRILKFNESEWGFVSYSKGVLTAFSLKDKDVSSFKINSVTFNRIYLMSNEGVVSQEAIDYIKLKEKTEKDLIKSLNRGVVFIGTDGSKYTFIRFEGKKILFFNNEGSYTANIKFVDYVTDDFNSDYMNYLEPVKTKKDFKALSLEEKIAIAVNYLNDCYSKDGEKCEVLDFGNILEGEAYYHEVDKSYTLIGLEIKYKYKFDFMEDFKFDVGFFPIYIGKLPNYYPISFDESHGDLEFRNNSYSNGCGDSIEYFVNLIDKKEIDKVSSKWLNK